MRPGKLTAYLKNLNSFVAHTNTQGKGPEDQQKQGKADPAGQVYQEQVNDTSPSRLRDFVTRAASTLSTTTGNIWIKDERGHLISGDSIKE